MPTRASTTDQGRSLRRLGTVTRLEAGSIEISFESQRCANCTCSMSGLALQSNAPPSLILPLDQLSDLPDVVAGERLMVTLPTQRFSAATALLFGSPLLVAVMFGGVGVALSFTPVQQGLTVVSAMLVGGLIGWLFTRRQQPLLKSALHNRLMVERIDC